MLDLVEMELFHLAEYWYSWNEFFISNNRNLNILVNNNELEILEKLNRNKFTVNNSKSMVSYIPQPVFINTSNVEINKVHILDMLFCTLYFRTET